MHINERIMAFETISASLRYNHSCERRCSSRDMEYDWLETLGVYLRSDTKSAVPLKVLVSVREWRKV